MRFYHQGNFVFKEFEKRTVVWFFLLFFASVRTFNVDTETWMRVFNGTTDTYFGISVGLLNNTQGKWLLVGAPRSNSRFMTNRTRPGALFQCPLIDGAGSCQEVELDSGENEKGRPGSRYFRHINHQDKQSLGIALDCQPDEQGGRVAVCAHLWGDQQYHGHILVNGMCYELDNNLSFSTITKLKPLTVMNKQIVSTGVYYFAHGQTGMSAHYTKKDGILLMGAPGVWDWTGSVVEHPTHPGFSALRRDHIVLRLPAEYKQFSQAGYAVSSGTFFPHKRLARVVGAPKANNRGKVFVYETLSTFYDHQARAKIPNIIIEKEGEQMGSYFGSAVCAVDINGDGLDDLLVGAPLYIDVIGDEGRVYVFLNMEMGKLDLHTVLRGSKAPFARFGTAISHVGDLNRDGFQDVVIGAPYEQDGVGAVYVYYGSEIGLRTQEAQRILGSQVDAMLRGFGYSFSRGMDVDDNGYPDFAVSAYNSDRAVLLYSRPIVSINITIDVTPRKIDTSSHLHDCIVDSRHYFCQQLTVCVVYSGHQLPDRMELQYNITVDEIGAPVDAIKPRAIFAFEERGRVTYAYNVTGKIMKRLKIQREKCRVFKMLVDDNPSDLLNPIHYAVDFGLPASSLQYSRPMMSRFTQTRATTQVEYAKDCGTDDLCTSDLKTTADILFKDSRTEIFLGADKYLTIRVVVDNLNEASYGTRLNVTFDRLIQFVNSKRLSGEVSTRCDLVNEYLEYGEITCDIGNPLASQSQVVLALTFDTSPLMSFTTEQVLLRFRNFGINIAATTDSNETETGNNKVSVTVPITLKAALTPKLKSDPEQLVYSKNASCGTSNNNTQAFSHIVDITNTGPCLIPAMKGEIYLPTLTMTGEILATAESVEISKGNITHIIYGNVSQLASTVTLTKDGSTDTPARDINENTPSLVNCESLLCSKFTIEDFQLNPGESVLITVHATINITTLKNIEGIKDVAMYTSYVLLQPSNEYKSFASRISLPQIVEISTDIYRREKDVAKVPGWVMALSIGVGVGLLATLIVTFWKCGFFKRKQREDLQRLLKEVEADQLVPQENDVTPEDDVKHRDGYEIPSPSYLNDPTSPMPLLGPEFADAFGY